MNLFIFMFFIMVDFHYLISHLKNNTWRIGDFFILLYFFKKKKG